MLLTLLLNYAIFISTTKQNTPHLSEAVTPIQLYQLVLDVKSNKIGIEEKEKVKIMTKTELINKYALDVSINTLQRLDEIVKLENIDNNWSEEKYISFDVIDSDTWQINFWGQDENIVFERVNDTNYFKAIL